MVKAQRKTKSTKSTSSLKSTAEQQAVDADWLRRYIRQWRREGGTPDQWAEELAGVASCEELRGRLMDVIAWLRTQAEALRHPITRHRTLTESTPSFDPKYPGEGIEDLLEHVEDRGHTGRRLAAQWRRNTKKGT